MMKKQTTRRLSTTHVIMLSFVLVILLGSLLLSLPISAADGKALPYVDALFTATTATCVTGLVTVPTVSAWSTFGHIVILVLIQIGGLGVITVLSGVMISLHKRLGLRDSHLLADAFNLNTMSDMAKFVKSVIIGTLTVEGIGALLYMPVFVPRFGARGIWIAVFNAISAFCNAGIDIFAENSLCDYACHPLVNFVTCALVVLGGLGYIVWWDVLRVLKRFKTHGFRCFSQLTLHSKIVLLATPLLIIGGGALILALEYNNPQTIGALSLFDKIQVSLFQSVTTRTAGFASVPQEALRDATALLCVVLMFIGGSPVGTAGGAKTVTIVVLAAAAVCTFKNRSRVTLLNRTVAESAVRKAVAVAGMSFTILAVSTLLLSAVTQAPVLDVLYETASATATVGLTRNLTPTLNVWGKLIVIGTMYLGRVGPISLAIAMNVGAPAHNGIKYPTEEISVG